SSSRGCLHAEVSSARPTLCLSREARALRGRSFTQPEPLVGLPARVAGGGETVNSHAGEVAGVMVAVEACDHACQARLHVLGVLVEPKVVAAIGRHADEHLRWVARAADSLEDVLRLLLDKKLIEACCGHRRVVDDGGNLITMGGHGSVVVARPPGAGLALAP